VVALAPKAEPSAEEAAESIVTGDADSYAGGITTSSGESNKAVETMPPVEKPLLPKPAPKVDTVAITRAYLREIRDELSRAKRYPVSAQRLGLQGVVIVAFVIDDAGSFTAITVKRSSGSDLLDRAAVETVKELSRKISRPKETGKLSLPLETALRFEILQ
jgi:protein TonB